LNFPGKCYKYSVFGENVMRTAVHSFDYVRFTH